MPTMQRLSAAAALAAVLTTLAACDTLRDGDTARLESRDTSNVAERYPITAELQRTSIDVSGYRDPGPQSSAVYFDTLRFVRAYAQQGRGPLQVLTPRRGGDRDVTMVRRAILATGIPSSQVRLMHRHDGGLAVTLSYDRVAAIGPDTCYDLSPLADPRAEKDSGTAFGCASQKNLAKMVADPSDLVVAAPEPDRSSDRRAAVHKHYRETVRTIELK